jgi:poly(3-hydroxybutyrate) depolymerase
MRRLVATLCLLLAAGPVAASFEDGRLSVVHDGVTRTAIVDAAPGLQDAPLLIVLHGGIGRAAMVRRRARIGLAAQGWAVAFPEALDDWSDGRTWPCALSWLISPRAARSTPSGCSLPAPPSAG